MPVIKEDENNLIFSNPTGEEIKREMDRSMLVIKIIGALFITVLSIFIIPRAFPFLALAVVLGTIYIFMKLYKKHSRKFRIDVYTETLEWPRTGRIIKRMAFARLVRIVMANEKQIDEIDYIQKKINKEFDVWYLSAVDDSNMGHLLTREYAKENAEAVGKRIAGKIGIPFGDVKLAQLIGEADEKVTTIDPETGVQMTGKKGVQIEDRVKSEPIPEPAQFQPPPVQSNYKPVKKILHQTIPAHVKDAGKYVELYEGREIGQKDNKDNPDAFSNLEL